MWLCNGNGHTTRRPPMRRLPLAPADHLPLQASAERGHVYAGGDQDPHLGTVFLPEHAEEQVLRPDDQVIAPPRLGRREEQGLLRPRRQTVDGPAWRGPELEPVDEGGPQ